MGIENATVKCSSCGRVYKDDPLTDFAPSECECGNLWDIYADTCPAEHMADCGLAGECVGCERCAYDLGDDDG